MSDIAPWIGGILMTFLAVFGLILTSQAVDVPFQLFGMALLLFGVLSIFGLISRATYAPARSANAQPAQPAPPGQAQ